MFFLIYTRPNTFKCTQTSNNFLIYAKFRFVRCKMKVERRPNLPTTHLFLFAHVRKRSNLQLQTIPVCSTYKRPKTSQVQQNSVVFDSNKFKPMFDTSIRIGLRRSEILSANRFRERCDTGSNRKGPGSAVQKFLFSQKSSV